MYKNMPKKNILLQVFILIVLCLAFILAGLVILVSRYYPLRYTGVIYEYSAEFGLTPEFICAVIHTESKFNKDAISSAGASGLMQIGESTAYWLADKMGIDDFHYDQIFDPGLNVRMGCYYLNLLKKRYDNTDLALCAYNAGLGNVDSWLDNPDYSGDGKTLENIPFKETRNFIRRVADAQRIYAVLLKWGFAPRPSQAALATKR